MPQSGRLTFNLRKRIREHVTPLVLLGEFEEVGLRKFHFPKQQKGTPMAQVFLEFDAPVLKRRAHIKNEGYIAEVQSQLHYSPQHGLSQQCKWAISPRMRWPLTFYGDRLSQHECDRK